MISRSVMLVIKFQCGSAIWTFDPHNSSKILENPEKFPPRFVDSFAS